MIYRVKAKYQFSYSLALLGSNWFYRTKLFLIIFFSPVFGIWPFGAFKFRIKNNDIEFVIFLTDRSDISVFDAIFVREEYKFDLPGMPKTIFDLGANAGFSTLYFKSKYPKSTIYAFEPDPFNFEKLTLNCAQFPDIHCLNIAISEKDETKEFFVSTKSSVSSSLIKRLTSDKTMTIKTRSLDSLLAELKIDQVDLLKFDIEGSEYDVFKNFHKLLIVKNLIGEVHLDLLGISKDDFMNIFGNHFHTKEKPTAANRFILYLNEYA